MPGLQTGLIEEHRNHLEVAQAKLELIQADTTPPNIVAWERLTVSTRVARLRLQFATDRTVGQTLSHLTDADEGNPLHATALCIARAQVALSHDYSAPVIDGKELGTPSVLLGTSQGKFAQKKSDFDIDAIVQQSELALERSGNTELNRDLVASVAILAQRLAASEHENHLWREQQPCKPAASLLLTPEQIRPMSKQPAGESAALEYLVAASEALVATGAWVTQIEVMHRWELSRCNQGIQAIATELAHKQQELNSMISKLDQLTNQQVSSQAYTKTQS